MHNILNNLNINFETFSILLFLVHINVNSLKPFSVLIKLEVIKFKSLKLNIYKYIQVILHSKIISRMSYRLKIDKNIFSKYFWCFRAYGIAHRCTI